MNIPNLDVSTLSERMRSGMTQPVSIQGTSGHMADYVEAFHATAISVLTVPFVERARSDEPLA